MHLSLQRFYWYSLICGLLASCSAGPNYSNGNLQPVTYQQLTSTLIVPKCVGCHSDVIANGGVSYASYSSTMASPGSVVPYLPYQSQMYKKTVSGSMPKDQTHLTGAELQMIYNWIALGARND